MEKYNNNCEILINMGFEEITEQIKNIKVIEHFNFYRIQIEIKGNNKTFKLNIVNLLHITKKCLNISISNKKSIDYNKIINSKELINYEAINSLIGYNIVILQKTYKKGEIYINPFTNNRFEFMKDTTLTFIKKIYS